jgi:RNA polymerase sigma factor (TIGR02999 family)
MGSDRQEAVTTLLELHRRGDPQALDDVFVLVYEELRRLARMVRRGRAGHTMDTTALVHEAYLKLIPSQLAGVNDRIYFYRVAARAMRQVLVDAARQRVAEKRGGGMRAVTFDEEVHPGAMHAEQLLIVDDALRRLESINARAAQVVECRFFAGLDVEETAQALEISAPTVKRDWRSARAWLVRHLDAA